MQLREDLKRFNRIEQLWLMLFLAIICGSTIWFSLQGTDWGSWQSVVLNWLVSPISAVSGVLCVVMVAKGLLSNWFWGLIGSLTYGLLAWTSGYYGDWLLNWFYLLPAQLFVYWSWKSQLHADTQTVRMRKLGWHWLWVIALLIFAVIAGAALLLQVDGFIAEAFKRNSAVYQSLSELSGSHWSGPLLDSSTVMLQITAQLLMIRMFAAQWPLWILTNTLNIFAWSLVLLTDPGATAYAVPTLIMWIAFLLNSVYGAFTWHRGSRVI
ncbi:nicotinamide riboside transporter PnuC [Chromatiaceae bacterium AAb-1]|nr:nicotinamide riboside transporter PnuC [Chromatiaceae bacterium AAb-1]